jgi:6-phosphogluconolactonase
MNVRTVVEDGERLPGIFAEWVERRASEKSGGSFSLAVPGGSVAERFLPQLQHRVFSRTAPQVFWVDERAVEADDPQSNYGLAKRVWLDAAGIPSEAIHPMVPAGRSLDAVVRDSQIEIEAVLGGPPRLDLALLGVGEDGHVASLFPGHSVLEAMGWVASLSDAPKPPPRRLTLTLSALLGADVVAIGAFGRAKAKVIAEALSPRQSDLPVSRVLRGARDCVLFLDEDAASEL